MSMYWKGLASKYGQKVSACRFQSRNAEVARQAAVRLGPVVMHAPCLPVRIAPVHICHNSVSGQPQCGVGVMQQRVSDTAPRSKSSSASQHDALFAREQSCTDALARSLLRP